MLEQAAYHHGDTSLQGTIIAMAHDFVGSNNINILHGEGQFGTRAQGGKDAASARYISVTIPVLTRKMFHHWSVGRTRMVSADSTYDPCQRFRGYRNW